MAYNSTNPNGAATSANSAPVVLASDQAAVAIKGNLGTPATAAWTSATAVSTVLAVNVSAFNAVSVAMSNTTTMTAGVLSFQVSPNSTTGSDGTWFSVTKSRIDSYTTESTYTLNAVANRAWTTSVDGFTYFRVALTTAITGTGTATLFVTPQTFAIEPMVTVGNATAANLQVQLGGGTQSIGNVTLNGGTNAIGQVGINPNTSTVSLTPFLSQTLSNTAVLIGTAGARRVFEYDFYNPNASGVWVQLFNSATAAAAAFGTNLIRQVYVPPTAGRDWTSVFSNAYSAGLVIACSGSNTSTTAPAGNITVYVGYI